MSALQRSICLRQPALQLFALRSLEVVTPTCVGAMQNIWSEECFIGWFNQLARDKIIPDYPALRKGKAS